MCLPTIWGRGGRGRCKGNVLGKVLRKPLSLAQDSILGVPLAFWPFSV